MKKTFSLIACYCSTLLLIFFFLLSCKKDGGPGSSHGSGLEINLSYQPNNSDVRNFELIISSKNGIILLDTIGPVDTKISATLKTNDRSFDVTVIHYDSTADQYTANTYTSVNPSSWTIIANGYPNYYSPVYGPPFTPATLHYYNAPDGQPYFINGPVPEQYTITPATGTVDIAYDRHEGNYTYLLFPASGLYNFHMPLTDADSVDLSRMDTAVAVNFAKPAQYQMVFTNLEGFMDTTDLSRYLWLYFNFNFNNGYDLQYPGKFVQKYEFAAAWSNSQQGYSHYYSFNDTVPAAGSIPFLDENNYSIGSGLADSFDIRFINEHPTYYETQWASGKVMWNLFSSPDATVQHPLHLFTTQKSQYMKGQDLSGLALNHLLFENAQGSEYATYFSYMFTPALLHTKRLRSSLIFEKFFGNAKAVSKMIKLPRN